jgi:hypothetical protein
MKLEPLRERRMEKIKNPPYRIVGIRKDKSELELAVGYPSRAWCFATATKIAIDVRVAGNPDKLDRLEIRDSRGDVLPEYANDAFLVV